jgi:hypothetical protein
MNLAFDQIYSFAVEHGYTGGDNNSERFVHFFREKMIHGMITVELRMPFDLK